MSEDTPWKEAIEIVLGESEDAMHYADIADEIVQRGLRVNVGATPANSVGSVISTEIKDRGQESRFKRVSQGHYMLRQATVEQTEQEVAEVESESEPKIIQAFGMFWRRDAVHWSSNPSLHGQQTLGAEVVNLGEERGIYFLHDRQSCVYVGKAFDRGIGKRLYDHTRDRLGGRWDRFSWFGVCDVHEDGSVALPPDGGVFSSESIVAALEAVLMEALETPQNRRQGDGLKGIEYLQAPDPELEKQELKTLLEQVKNKI